MKIICVGRNYADHAKELKNAIPSEPVLFIKPETARIIDKQPFFLPSFSKDVHYEVEVLIKINRVGKHIEERFAHRYYDEIGLGIDFTARDVQTEMKEKGLPWEKAKAFDGSAMVGKFAEKASLGDLNGLAFRLERNGEVVQKGNTSNMLFPIDRLIAEISKYFTLKKGDIIFTGTPEGVGPVFAEDRLQGFIGDKEFFSLRVK